jgi:hypothetical protein
MANEKIEEMEVLDPEEYIEFEAFYDGDKYKDDILVTVNGERCLIKRGVRVKVKRKFVEVIRNGEAQDVATARRIESLEKEFEDESKKI